MRFDKKKFLKELEFSFAAIVLCCSVISSMFVFSIGSFLFYKIPNNKISIMLFVSGGFLTVITILMYGGFLMDRTIKEKYVLRSKFKNNRSGK